MRILALSNEPSPGADPDVPWALARLAERGLVHDHAVYPLRAAVASRGSRSAAEEIAAIADALQADVLAFFHAGSCRLSDEDLDIVRRASPQAVWIYREGDAYQRWTLPYHRSILATVRRCAAAFLPCGGYFPDIVRHTGCGFVTYAPSWVNPERFPYRWPSSPAKEYDVVFVGNDMRARLRPVPGVRERRRLVRRLQERYGSRAAIYGRGWTGKGARGPLPLEAVGEAYAASCVAVGMDHVVGPYQFSNRLPTALACGVPLAYALPQSRVDALASMDSSQLFVDEDGAVAVIDRLLATDASALNVLSAHQRRLSLSFACDRVMAYMLEVAAALRSGRDPRALPNPWLKEAHARL